jgi:hypothetical protein
MAGSSPAMTEDRVLALAMTKWTLSMEPYRTTTTVPIETRL